MQTAPHTAQQGPSGNRPLTIDTNRLRDLWLPAENRERQTIEYLEGLYRRKENAKKVELLSTAIVFVTLDHRKTITSITERGGLLLIGGAA